MHESFLFLEYLAIILVGAKLAAEICYRMDISPVLGEILIGFLLGASCLGWINLGTHEHEAVIVRSLSELGVIFMMFYIGLEVRISQIAKIGFIAISVAAGGIFIPLIIGYSVGLWMYPQAGWATHLFIGAIMAATSVAVTARIMLDLGLHRSRASRIILAAAVLDDILGLVVLSIVLAATRIPKGTGGGEPIHGLAAIFQNILGLGNGLLLNISLIVFFLVVLFPILWVIVPKILLKVEQLNGKGSLLVIVLGLMLLCAFVAAECGLAPIIGAFLFGMIVGSSKASQVIEEEVEPIFLFLAPVFFVTIGLLFDVNNIAASWHFAIILTIAAVLSKLIGSGFAAKTCGASNLESTIIGLGMVPRGEVGLIIANIGLITGVVSGEIFAGAVVMCILTIVVVPPFLKILGKKYQKVLIRETAVDTY